MTWGSGAPPPFGLTLRRMGDANAGPRRSGAALTPVHVNSLAVGEGGALGAEKEARLGDVRRAAQVAHGNVRDAGLQAAPPVGRRLPLMAPGTMQLVRTPWGPSSWARARVRPITPILAAGQGHGAASPLHGGQATDVDDAPPFLSKHSGGQAPGQQKGGVQVHGQQTAPLLRGRLQQGGGSGV